MEHHSSHLALPMDLDDLRTRNWNYLPLPQGTPPPKSAMANEIQTQKTAEPHTSTDLHERCGGNTHRYDYQDPKTTNQICGTRENREKLPNQTNKIGGRGDIGAGVGAGAEISCRQPTGGRAGREGSRGAGQRAQTSHQEPTSPIAEREIPIAMAISPNLCSGRCVCEMAKRKRRGWEETEEATDAG